MTITVLGLSADRPSHLWSTFTDDIGAHPER
ncbi:MAG: hypothetical protein QOH37_1174 [Nocardioidaceae bacterium]|jgi:hypothetical protein|nr:hypothetical protein [Nocardioidaceae bacterium]